MTKIKKKTKNKSPNKSPYPDNSTERRIWEQGYRKGCNDMDAAIGDIRLQGFLDHCLITLYLLKDKYKSSDEDLAQLNKDMHQYADWITTGFRNLEDIKKSLKDVHGIEFEVTDNREK